MIRIYKYGEVDKNEILSRTKMSRGNGGVSTSRMASAVHGPVTS